MDSPRSPFMVPSTNSFHKDAKGTKVATRREFDAWNEEPKLPALMRTTKSPTTTPKPMRTPAKPTRRSSPEPYAPCKPAEAKTIRRLAPKAPPTKPLASSPPASKKPLQMVTPPPSEKRLLCRAPSMPTKTPEPEPSTRASPATKAVSLPKTAGIVRRSTPTKQLPTPPPTPPLVLNPRKVAECGPRRQAVHVKIPKPASPAPEKRARSTVTPVLKKVSAKTSDAQKQTETVGHLSANGAASAQEAEGEADRSRATAKVALARGNAVAAPKKYTTVHRPLAKPSSCKTMDKKVAEPQVERSIVRAARPVCLPYSHAVNMC
ncbi:hypothetical protein PsYK624_090910 [Phanerochaete sordida]|uniref:Uncharacterized protein n=1 Tax=Phanerochaete sordida TaxID=48140 RepID=A0A9P3GBX6_9APHY|nr:hypothetical protein PsYK624_090910 [Phanerochaete sordida]